MRILGIIRTKVAKGIHSRFGHYPARACFLCGGIRREATGDGAQMSKAYRLWRGLRAWWRFQHYVTCGDKGGWLISPPAFLRHVTPWRLLGWINRHSGICWANVVMWKMWGADTSWWPTKGCFGPHDYCGKFDGDRTPQFSNDIVVRFMGDE